MQKGLGRNNVLFIRKTKAHIYNGKIRHTDDVHDLTPENVGNSRIAIFRDGEDITSGRTANEVNDGAYIETVDSMGQSHYSYVEGKKIIRIERLGSGPELNQQTAYHSGTPPICTTS